jgi:HTH-type transcriptional regulator/antitoxin HigA
MGAPNAKKYSDLLALVQPRVIRNDKELDRFTALLLELDEKLRPTREEKDLAELLTTLIQQYEAKHYPVEAANPEDTLKFLMEQHSRAAKDLWPVIGSKDVTSEILSGKRRIGIALAAKLGEFFHFDPAVLIDWKAAA